MSDLTERTWLCIRLNNAGKYFDITLKTIVRMQNVCKNCVRILEEAPYVRYLVKKVKKTGILIDKPKREKPKTVRIKTLVWVWRHTKINWFRNWSQLPIQCVFALLRGTVIDLQKMPILAKKKVNFSDEAYFDKQAKLSHLGRRKPYIEKPMHPN